MRPINLISLLLFLAAIVWVLTLSEKTVQQVHATYYSMVSPFLKSGSSIERRAQEFIKEVEHSKNLEKQVSLLEKNLGTLQVYKNRFHELEKENSELRAALHFKERTRFNVITARVIRRNPSTWWKTAIIDRGQESGIGVQVPVLSYGGLVGKIDQTTEGMSTLLLLTDEACQVSAKIEDTPEVGIVSGIRGKIGQESSLKLRYLSKEAPITKGMKVYTTGRGGLFPPNVLIGTISAYESGSFDGIATVTPSVDFKSLNIVFAITDQ